MSRDAEYRLQWEARRPHLPFPLLDGQISSRTLENFTSPAAWTMKPDRPRDHDLWDMSRPILCGFFIPPFQRPIVWEDERQVAFVESAYLGFHLGTIVYNDCGDEPLIDGRFHYMDRWLIDGQQRLTALWRYVTDEFPVFVGTPNEHRFSELNEIERRVFDQIVIGTTKLTSTNEQQIRMVYDRLNFGGVPHTEGQRALPGGNSPYLFSRPQGSMPTQAEVVSTLSALGGEADAISLCNALVKAGHSTPNSQLAMQRAVSAGAIVLKNDWTYSLSP